MIWIIYSDYLNGNVRVNSYVRYLKWHVWAIFLLVLLITIGLFIAFIYYDLYWVLWITCLTGGVGGLFFGNEIRKVVSQHVGTHEDIYEHNIITLRQILIRRNLYNINKIDLLILQVDEELPDLKASERQLKSMYTFSTILLIPILTLLIKWILDKYTEGWLIVSQLITLIIMIFGIYFMVKPLVEQVIDSPFWRMKKLKKMLQDVKLIDFV
ncbi:hypothetical protein B5G50_27950 [Brevibacillus brevis]|uniref:hypothetical protein n=1 Tax=Brevibacillus brevis TaxID=1393 RepID=UPI000B3A4828|nr:hypothetical protein [Brevibacillus brevis]OUQ85225.1 hypothetical protein B5G50_27950 [Brevibacillus brevis]